MSSRIVVTHALRTPIGRYLGSYRELTAVDLGVCAVDGLLRAASLDPGRVSATLYGHARQAGCGPNPARQVAVRAGIPDSSPAYTVNMACGSGLKTLQLAADDIRAGRADIVVTGGMEQMTRVPFLLDRARLGYRLGHAKVLDGMYRDGFVCPISDMVMGETAELLAQERSIGRAEQDAFAATSQNRCQAAREAGRFSEEIVPVAVREKKGERIVDADEHPRDGVTAESLAKLPPVFDSVAGTVTAGNSSGITDAAAALLVMSADRAESLGYEPLAAIEEVVSTGVDPKRMGLGPIPATKALLDRTGLSLDDFGLVEINEAFAAQVLACLQELPVDPSILNVNGGSIALGHPIGCTGARFVVTLLHEMRRRGTDRGLATLCVSGGLGLAASFRRS